MIELRLLQSFVAVAETEHVGRAAERMHISQSPLSRQIRQLEADLGLRLFDRERQRIRLTESGRWLLTEARELLGRAQRIREDAAGTVRGDRGRLSIGFVNSALWNRVMPSALRKFQRARPHVHLDLRTLASEMQVRRVLGGDLDVGLVHRAVPHTDLVCAHLFDDPFVLAVPARHRLAELHAIRAVDLRGEPWIGLSRTLHPTAHLRFAQLARRAGFVPDVRHETSDRATVLALVEAGLGIALLPSSARRVATHGVAFRELPWPGITTGVHLIHRREPSAATTLFADLAIAGARRAAP